MDADGGNPRQLTSELVSEHSPCWSPDGKQIAYVARDGLVTDLWVTYVR